MRNTVWGSLCARGSFTSRPPPPRVCKDAVTYTPRPFNTPHAKENVRVRIRLSRLRIEFLPELYGMMEREEERRDAGDGWRERVTGIKGGKWREEHKESRKGMPGRGREGHRGGHGV